MDRGRVGLAAALAAVTTLAALPGAASAEDVEAILRHGNDLRRQGRDAEALTEFQRAARLEPSPRTTAQMALAEQALGMWPEAESHLSNALGREGDPWIRKNRVVLDKALATIHSHLCLVEVWGLPAGALILVDGKRIGSLPSASAWLSPGEVSMQVKADGYVPLKRTLAIPSAGNVREHVTLRSAKEAEAAEGVGTRPPVSPRAAPSRPAAVAAADPPAPARRDPPPPELRRIAATDDAGTRPAERSAGAPSLVDSGRDDAAPGSASALRRSAKWISWGVAVVGGGIGTYGLLRNHNLVSSFDSRCAVDPRTDTPYATDLLHATDASCASSRQDYQAAGRLALYGFVGAAVLGTVGLVFWLTEPAPRAGRTVLATCAPELALDRALLGCRMRF